MALLSRGPQALQIRVEDRGARYPITIDPLLTSTDDALIEQGDRAWLIDHAWEAMSSNAWTWLEEAGHASLTFIDEGEWPPSTLASGTTTARGDPTRRSV